MYDFDLKYESIDVPLCINEDVEPSLLLKANNNIKRFAAVLYNKPLNKPLVSSDYMQNRDKYIVDNCIKLLSDDNKNPLVLVYGAMHTDDLLHKLLELGYVKETCIYHCVWSFSSSYTIDIKQNNPFNLITKL